MQETAKWSAPKRILIVDDEPSILKLMKSGLSGSYDVTIATSGGQGLQEFQRDPFDLVISDRAMPEMDGLELADAVKSASPATPVLLISGVGSVGGDVYRVDAFLRKPFTLTQLKAAVDELLPPFAD